VCVCVCVPALVNLFMCAMFAMRDSLVVKHRSRLIMTDICCLAIAEERKSKGMVSHIFLCFFSLFFPFYNWLSLYGEGKTGNSVSG